jgi:hypothetical protein
VSDRLFRLYVELMNNAPTTSDHRAAIVCHALVVAANTTDLDMEGGDTDEIARQGHQMAVELVLRSYLLTVVPDEETRERRVELIREKLRWHPKYVEPTTSSFSTDDFPE